MLTPRSQENYESDIGWESVRAEEEKQDENREAEGEHSLERTANIKETKNGPGMKEVTIKGFENK